MHAQLLLVLLLLMVLQRQHSLRCDIAHLQD
jgi:hypothetical protein